jgi:hypothetical protein
MYRTLVLVLAAAPAALAAPTLDPRAKPLPTDKLGPFVRLKDGGVLCVEKDAAFVSRDGGKTWGDPLPMFPKGGVTVSNERAALVTKDGTVVVAFMNLATRSKGYWDAKAADFVPGVKLDVWAARSADGGKTWDAQLVQPGYSGAVRGLVQAANGNLVLVTQDVVRDPARHVTTAYHSEDDGKSWKRSGCVDKDGKRHPHLDVGGHGHHDGAIEPTVEVLKDGRLWMLVRTPRNVFYQAFSKDHGAIWADFGPTTIDASSAPGMLKRLASGRLLLVWNRTRPETPAEFPSYGPPWHAKEANYHRLELSAALSDDDGKTWTKPVVLARVAKGWLAYPYVFEPAPGELWVTTMQGGGRFAVAEKDLLPAPGGAAPARPQPPAALGPAPGRANVVGLPDGSWEAYRAVAGKDGAALVRVKSADRGKTWGDPERLRDLPAEPGSVAVALLDTDGEVHLFLTKLRLEGEGKRVAVDRFIDVWHARSSGGRKKWTEPARIFAGYTGAVMAATQLPGGRIVLPFGEWVAGRPVAPPTGAHVVTAVYTDDGGATWKRSAAALTAPCAAGFNGNNYGACEPGIVTLKDGRAWMLMRTQAGSLYESFSPDGTEWSAAKPTRFASSSSPPAVARLSDGRLALAWNHCEMPPRADGQGVYGGRDALHLAVSADDGKTWRGFREVLLDAHRDDSPPKTGDRGTAYPALLPTPDGKVAVFSGQGAGRGRAVLVDPDWLLETRRADDFSGGLGGWSTFTEFGPARGYWRDRCPGAVLAAHPDRPDVKALHVRRPAGKPGDGAVWNFPAGAKGTLALRVRLRPGFGGGSVALGDRFFNPTDDAGEAKAAFRLAIPADGRLAEGVKLEPGRWHALELAWDAPAGRCAVKLDGRAAVALARQSPADAVSYLRLRSTAAGEDPAGLLVESVAADVTP